MSWPARLHRPVWQARSPAIHATKYSTQHNATETVQHAAVEDAALSQRQRMQLPYYAKCFQSPTFTSGPLNGECEVLHMPRTSSIVHPVQTFREQSTIRIDVSACAFYLNSTAVGADDSAHAIDLMQPFEVSLRPNSTDHDVFLQVCSVCVPATAAYLISRSQTSCAHAAGLTHVCSTPHWQA